MAGPGVCLVKGAHGLQRKSAVPSADGDLRNLLHLSREASAAQVMHDAATEIRKLRDGELEVVAPVDVPPPKRRGRPPGSRNRKPDA